MFTECRAFSWRPLALCAAGAAQAEQKQKKKNCREIRPPPHQPYLGDWYALKMVPSTNKQYALNSIVSHPGGEMYVSLITEATVSTELMVHPFPSNKMILSFLFLCYEVSSLTPSRHLPPLSHFDYGLFLVLHIMSWATTTCAARASIPFPGKSSNIMSNRDPGWIRIPFVWWCDFLF